MNIEPGQTLYRINRKGVIESVTVSKVGRKYFYLKESYNKEQYGKTTLLHDGDGYTQRRNQLYFSEQELLDRQEYKQHMEDIRKQFTQYDAAKLSLQQLRDISNIIKAK